MNTREIAFIITFAALTIALAPIRIPLILLPNAYFRFCEIPIVVAFMLLGPTIGISIGGLNVFAEIVLFPGPTAIVGRPANFVLTLGMLIGIYFAQRLLKRKTPQKPNPMLKPAAYYTALGAFLRITVAPLVMYPFWRCAVPALAGVPFSDVQVMALIPNFMIAALIFSLYTIPIGYLIARVVSRNLNVGNQL